MDKGWWYCLKYNRLVEPCYVLNDETHENCGGICITREQAQAAINKYLDNI
jgi:hypothetical protein